MEEEYVSSSEKQLTAERLKAFQDALEVLYIPGNMGGRLRFAEGWAPAARYIFGEELSRIDRDGTRDKERRMQLENEAEERRAALAETVEDLEKNSADRGVLQIEYVQKLITDLGRETALYLYAPWLVDRFAPARLSEVVADAPATKQSISQDPGAYEMAEAALPTELTQASAPPPVAPERFEDEQEQQQQAAPEITPIDTMKPMPEHMSPPLEEPAPVPEIMPIDTAVPSSPPVAHVAPEEKPKAPARKTLKIFGIKDDVGKDGAGS